MPRGRPKKKNKGGRPPHKPDDQSRRFVEAMAIAGKTQAHIARVLEISVPTLCKHYRDELDRSAARADAKVVSTLFDMATSGKNTPATIFWMRARVGWSEKQRMELTGADGGPIALIAERAQRLNNDELRAVEQGLTKLLEAGDDLDDLDDFDDEE